MMKAITVREYLAQQFASKIRELEDQLEWLKTGRVWSQTYPGPMRDITQECRERDLEMLAVYRKLVANA
jgi:hypothetical protein